MCLPGKIVFYGEERDYTASPTPTPTAATTAVGVLTVLTIEAKSADFSFTTNLGGYENDATPAFTS